MQAVSVIRIEKNVDRAASALFAMACAYAVDVGFNSNLEQPALGAGAALCAALLGFLISNRSLAAVQAKPRSLPVPIFDVREVQAMDGPELLRTEFETPPPAEEPLLLQDILAEPEPDSRVVRLFDPAAMPVAGESRIDWHLDGEISEAQTNEAARALHDALNELRRSLR